MKKSKTVKIKNVISHSKTQENTYKLHLVPLENGIKRVKYELLELHPEQECLINEIYSTFVKQIRDLKDKKEWFVTLELAQKHNWTILGDKSIFLDKNTLHMKWLQIAVQELIGKEKDYLPFYNNLSMEISKKLLLPTETGCLESHSTCLNKSSTCMEQKSWFSTIHRNHHLNKNLFRTFYPLYTSTLVNKWENEDTHKQRKKKKLQTKSKKQPPNGIIKVRILPTLKQQAVFKRWLGGTNYTYNHALYDIKRKKAEPHFNLLVASYANDCDRYGNRRLPEFLSFTPTEIRKAALNDLTSAYDSAKTNRRVGNIKHYEVDYRRKKKQRRCFSFSIPYESIRFYIDKKYPDEYRVDLCPTKMKECMTNTLRKGKTKTKSILDECRLLQKELDVLDYFPVNNKHVDYKNMNTKIDIIDKKLKQNTSPKENVKRELGSKSEVNTSIRVARLSRPGRNKSLDNLINSSSLNYNSRLCYKYGFWYLHIPYIRTQYQEPKIDNQDMVALDPGFKTFQTYFSSSGKYGKYQHDERRLKRICSMLDYYNWSLTSWHKPKYVRYKTDKLYRKQLHLIDEMHRKIIQDITSQYNWIFLPSFETQDMLVGKSYNKKHREAKRHAYQLAHYKFKTRLINRCEQLDNCKLLIVSEAYTTKTCSCCGWIWENMTTKDRIFKCKQCDLVIDRDVNAARNILIRTLTG